MRFKTWLEKSEDGVSQSHPDPGSFGKPKKPPKTSSDTKIKVSKHDEKSDKDGVPSTSAPWKNYTQKCDHGFKDDGKCRPAGKEA